MPIKRLGVLVLVAPMTCLACEPLKAGTRAKVPDAATAVTLARVEWAKEPFAASVAKHEPYKAELRDGVWFVYGSLLVPLGTFIFNKQVVVCKHTSEMSVLLHPPC